MDRRKLLLLFGAAAFSAAGRGAVAAESATGDRTVALTFDDGPHPALTPLLLDILGAERVPATFYVVGSRVALYPDIVRYAHDSGHEIGNHSWSHPFLTRISLARAADEIARTDEMLYGLSGALPNTVRPPYGAMNSRVEDLTVPRPMVLWDVDTNDWRNRYAPSVARAATNSTGGIVLMHDIHATTVHAVPAIIRDFKDRGFRFVTVSNYLEETARSLPRSIDPAWNTVKPFY